MVAATIHWNAVFGWTAFVAACLFAYFIVGLIILLLFVRFSSDNDFRRETGQQVLTIVLGPIALALGIVLAPIWVPLVLLVLGAIWLFNWSTAAATSARTGNG